MVRKFVAYALCAAFALVLPACSGGSSPSPTSLVPSATTRTVSDAATVKDYSGSFTFNNVYVYDSCKTGNPIILGKFTLAYNDHVVYNTNGLHFNVSEDGTFTSTKPTGYTGTYTYKNNDNINFHGADTYTYHSTFDLDGPNGSYQITVLIHVTYNANGQRTATVFDFDYACK